jgi:hypothetical protein
VRVAGLSRLRQGSIRSRRFAVRRPRTSRIPAPFRVPLGNLLALRRHGHEPLHHGDRAAGRDSTRPVRGRLGAISKAGCRAPGRGPGVAPPADGELQRFRRSARSLVRMGTVDLAPGSHIFRFTVVRKNLLSRGYYLGINYVLFKAGKWSSAGLSLYSSFFPVSSRARSGIGALYGQDRQFGSRSLLGNFTGLRPFASILLTLRSAGAAS